MWISFSENNAKLDNKKHISGGGYKWVSQFEIPCIPASDARGGGARGASAPPKAEIC